MFLFGEVGVHILYKSSFFPYDKIWEKSIMFFVFFRDRLFLWGGFEKLLSQIFPPFLITFLLKESFIGGRGGPFPHFFCNNLSVSVKLGYTPNFTILSHLEVRLDWDLEEIWQLNKMLISVFEFMYLNSHLKCATMGRRFQNMKVTKSSEISYTSS